MRTALALGFVVLPLAATCGGATHGTVVIDQAARQAGARVEVVDSKGKTREIADRALPVRLDPGETAFIHIGAREVSVEASPGSVVSVSGPRLDVSPLPASAIEVTGSHASANRLASFIGAQVRKSSAGVYVLSDGRSDVVERAALAMNDSEIANVRTVALEGVEPAAMAITIANPLVQPAPAFDTSRRFATFFGYCGTWMPSANEPFTASFEDGSIATGRTDPLGLVLLDEAPSLTPTLPFAHGIAGLPPRPYVLDAAKPETAGNVTVAMQKEDTDTVAWALMDAARSPRPEWSDGVVRHLTDAHAGLRSLAAAALLRYPPDVQERGLATVTDAGQRDALLYVLGRPSSHPQPAPVWTSGAP